MSPAPREKKCRFTLRSRTVAVLLFGLAGLILSMSSLGVQLAWFLTYAAAVLSSLCASNAIVFVALLGVASAALFVRFLGKRVSGLKKTLIFDFTKGFLSVVNREGSHLEAELVWILALFISTDSITAQLLLLGALLFFAEPLLDYAGFVLKERIGDAAARGGSRQSFKEAFSRLAELLAHPWKRELGGGEPREPEERYLVCWARRPFISIAAVAGCHTLLLVPFTADDGARIAVGIAFALLGALLSTAALSPSAPRLLKIAAFVGSTACSIAVFAVSPEQKWAIAWFLGAVGANAFFRLGKWIAVDNRPPKGATEGAWNVLDHYRDPENLRELTRVRAVDGPLMIAAPIAGLAAVLVLVSGAYAAAEKGRDEKLHACSGAMPSASILEEERVRVFLAADTQLHNLAGERFPGQMEVATALVPVARRPVELDLLSEGALRHFASMFAHYRSLWPDMTWAYLGDFTDLACVSEMRRMVDALAAFDPRAIAGLAPGNHDNAFTGNFKWSPYWEKACREGGAPFDAHLGKALSDGMLTSAFGEALSRGGKLIEVTGPAGGASKALVGYHALGVLGKGSTPLEIIGVFLDTSDKLDSDYGVAGSVGTLSKRQVDALLGDEEFQREAVSLPNARFAVFTHHPIDELGPGARERLEEIVDALELGGRSHRVIGFVSAHTHKAAMRYEICLGDKSYDNAIIGSTTDPPQEAALLEIGFDSFGEVAAEVTTLPAIERPSATCGGLPAYGGAPTSERCARVVERLRKDACCAALFQRQDGRPFTSCAELGRHTPLAKKMLTVAGLGDPASLETADALRAEHLLTCLASAGREPPEAACAEIPKEETLRNDYFPKLIESGMLDPDRREEIVCLGWAASAVQAYRESGMEFADALECAFDPAFEDGAIQPAKRMPLVLRERSCL